MLVRIVKLTFKQDCIADFLQIYEGHREDIKSFDGFSSIELFKEKSHPQVLFTHSIWVDEAALENYRASAYFRDIWLRTKILFSAKAEAWSLEKA